MFVFPIEKVSTVHGKIAQGQQFVTDGRVMKFFAHCVLVTMLVTALISAPLMTLPASASTPRTASVEAQNLWAQVKDEYSAVTPAEIGKYVGLRTRFSEYLRATQMAKKKNGNQQPSAQQIQEQLEEFALQDAGYHRSVPKAQADLDRLMPLLIDTMNPVEKNVETLRQKKLNLLAGLAYLYRYYDFTFGEQRAIDSILFDTTPPATSRTTAYSRVLGIRTIEGNLIIGPQTTEQYAQKIARYTGYPTVTAFIEGKLAQHLPGKTAEQWFKETTKAYVFDTGKRPLWTKFSEDEAMRDYLLPLLNLSDNSLYVGNSEYSIHLGLTNFYGGAENAQFQAELERTVRNDQRFTDFWMRMTHAPEQMNYKGHVVVVDTWKKPGANFNNVRDTHWKNPYETGEDAALLDLFYNMQIRNAGQRVGAQAAGSRIDFFFSQALGNGGINTYAHEMTHIYDQKVWFNGHGRRPKMAVEDYARGLFETLDNTQNPNGQNTYPPLFMLNLAYDLGENRHQNQNPERFATREDVFQYSQGLMDVINSLDAMEALESLKLPAADKALLFNKVTVAPNTRDTWPGDWSSVYENSWKDVFTKLTADEAGKLTTIDDLVDQQILSSKYFPKGIATSEAQIPINEYVVIPLFEPIYAGLAPTNEGTGAVMFRRYAYDILGEYGWDNGFIAYLSGQYATEQEALQGILTKHGGNIATFKKDMYKRRVDNFAKMKPAAGFATAAQMQEAMKQAVAQDLATIKANQGSTTVDPAFNATAVRALKERILAAYLNDTNDFRTSIYQEREGKVTHAITATVTQTAEGKPRPFTDTDFTFTLTGADDTSSTVKGLPTSPVAAPADGNLNMGTLEFTKPGTYTYTLAQIAGNNSKVTYDQAPVTIAIEVEWASESSDPKAQEEMATAGKDILRIKSVNLTKNKQQITDIVFTNVYTPERTTTEKVEETPIPIEDEIILNPDVSVLAEDRILSEGKVGVRTTRTVTTFVDGVQEGDPVVETTIEPMEKRRIERGTKALPLQPAPKPAPTHEGHVEQELALKVNLVTDKQNPRAYSEDEFNVTLIRVDSGSANALTGLPKQPVKVPASGEVSLGTVTIHDAGTYTLRAQMVKGSNVKITYDARPITITIVTRWQPRMTPGVSLRSAGEETLVVTSVTYTRTNDAGEDAELAEKDRVFTNIYTPKRGVESESRTEKIVITETVQYDPTVLASAEAVVQDAGEEGERTITLTWETEDDVRIGEPQEKSEVTKQMRPRVVRKGSKLVPLQPAQPIKPEQPQPVPNPENPAPTPNPGNGSGSEPAPNPTPGGNQNPEEGTGNQGNDSSAGSNNAGHVLPDIIVVPAPQVPKPGLPQPGMPQPNQPSGSASEHTPDNAGQGSSTAEEVQSDAVHTSQSGTSPDTTDSHAAASTQRNTLALTGSSALLMFVTAAFMAAVGVGVARKRSR